MGRGSLGSAQSRASLGRPSMGAPGRWLAHEAWTLGTRLALAHGASTAERYRCLSPRVGAGLGDQDDDDGDEDYADELAAVLNCRMGPEHAARGIAGSQC